MNYSDTILYGFLPITAGKTIPIEVMPLDTIGDIKAKIQEKEGILVEQQQLAFGHCNNLEDSKKIGEYKIEKDSKIHLIWKVKLIIKVNEGKTIF